MASVLVSRIKITQMLTKQDEYSISARRSRQACLPFAAAAAAATTAHTITLFSPEFHEKDV